MATKPEKRDDTIEVIYSSEHWALLHGFRQKTAQLLRSFRQRHLHAIVHGSIARGDVKPGSDIDIFLPNPSSSFLVETALEQEQIPIRTRIIIQATPLYAMKAYLELDSTTTISFPLMSLRRVEREFYRFSGEASLKDIEAEIRVAGVDKRLMLIEPTFSGHIESSIIGKEEYVAKRLGVAVETVRDRVHALMKRDAVGRTGVFVKKELPSDETFEMALKRLAETNPAVRRRLK